jgi:hypothetical protein
MTKTINFVFAPGSGTATRSATAAWGTLSSFTDVFPLTIGTCAMSSLVPGQKVTLHSHNFGACPNGPGQFGWLDISCSSPTKVDTSGGLDGTTGNTPKSCTDAQLDSFLGKDIMVPVFDPTKTCGGHTYCITSFAQFHLTGWSGNGNTFGAQPPSTLGKHCDDGGDGVSPPSSDTKPCIRGYFIKPVLVEQIGQFTPGGCTASSLFICRIYLSS